MEIPHADTFQRDKNAIYTLPAKEPLPPYLDTFHYTLWLVKGSPKPFVVLFFCVSFPETSSNLCYKNLIGRVKHSPLGFPWFSNHPRATARERILNHGKSLCGRFPLYLMTTQGILKNLSLSSRIRQCWKMDPSCPYSVLLSIFPP